MSEDKKDPGTTPGKVWLGTASEIVAWALLIVGAFEALLQRVENVELFAIPAGVIGAAGLAIKVIRIVCIRLAMFGGKRIGIKTVAIAVLLAIGSFAGGTATPEDQKLIDPLLEQSVEHPVDDAGVINELDVEDPDQGAIPTDPALIPVIPIGMMSLRTRGMRRIRWRKWLMAVGVAVAMMSIQGCGAGQAFVKGVDDEGAVKAACWSIQYLERTKTAANGTALTAEEVSYRVTYLKEYVTLKGVDCSTVLP